MSTRSSSSSSSPSTPVEEEDLAQASAWHSDEEPIPPPFPAKWKGKGREVDGNQPIPNGGTAYPPTADEEVEERRIQNNLRNWEHKERQKRRQTRDIAVSESLKQPPSVVDDVSRRASTLWKNFGGRQKVHRPSGSDHQVLQDAEPELGQEDGEVELRAIESSPLGSPLQTPTPTQNHKELPDGEEEPPTPRNPFVDPVQGDPLKGPRNDIIEPNGSAIMDPLPTPPATEISALGLGLTTSPTSAESPYTRQPAPPQPLSIPPPKTPPPFPNSLPRARAAASSSTDINEEEPGKGRWWTEWLCGCSEGSDRGGDNQAGKTNPFE